MDSVRGRRGRPTDAEPDLYERNSVRPIGGDREATPMRAESSAHPWPMQGNNGERSPRTNGHLDRVSRGRSARRPRR